MTSKVAVAGLQVLQLSTDLVDHADVSRVGLDGGVVAASRPPAFEGPRRDCISSNSIAKAHASANRSPVTTYGVVPVRAAIVPLATTASPSSVLRTILPHGSTIAEIPVFAARASQRRVSIDLMRAIARCW
jgi:hypothetical protein